MRKCSACGETKPLEHFNRRSSAKDGRQSRCRSCEARASQDWRRANADRVVANNRRWRQENPGTADTATRRWRQENEERYKAAKALWQERNRDRRLERARQDRAANPDKYRSALAAWKVANPERVREYQRKRRAAGYGGALGKVDAEIAWLRDGGACGLCGLPIDHALSWPDPESASLDHILPLAKGGMHDQDNVQWAHLVCNLRKGARSL